MKKDIHKIGGVVGDLLKAHDIKPGTSPRPTTKTTNGTTPMSNPSKDPKMFKENSKFETKNDDVLCTMLDSADAFIKALSSDKPYMLSFLGNSGTGKTMLAKAIYAHAIEFNRHYKTTISDGDHVIPGITQVREIYFKTMGDITQTIFDQQRYQFQYCMDAWLLVIDDFGTEFDKSGYVLSKLLELINARLGKWTVITSNLTLNQIANDVDPRIASRLVRDGGRVVDCSTQDFGLR